MRFSHSGCIFGPKKDNLNINLVQNNRWKNANQNRQEKISPRILNLAQKFLHSFEPQEGHVKMEQGPERERKRVAQEAGGGFDLIKGEGKTGASETG